MNPVQPYLKKHLGSLVVATVCSVLLGLVSAVTFSLVGPAIEILTSPDKTRLVTYVELLGANIGGWIGALTHSSSLPIARLWEILPWMVVACACVRAVLAIVQWYLWEKSSEHIARHMRSEVIGLYLATHPEQKRLRSERIDQEIGSAISTDIRGVREYLVHVYGGFPRELIQVCLYLATLLVLDWKLSALFFLGLGPAGIVLSRLGKKLRKRSQAALNNSSTLLEWLQERFSGLETIKQFRTEALEIEKMRAKSFQLLSFLLKATRVKSRTSPLLQVIAVGAMMIVLSYALRSLAREDMSSSTLLSFFSILGILSQSAAKLGRYHSSSKEGEAAALRLEALKNEMRAIQAPHLSLPFAKTQDFTVELRGLGYLYPKAEAFALRGFDAQLKKGEIYAVAGASGSGKTTLIKLLLGLWAPTEGDMLLGISTRAELGYLPQHVQLLQDSLLANLSYPDATCDRARMELALKKVGLFDYLSSLPNGLESRVGEGGDIILSGGQAQRIQLARLLYHRPPLVIIDEGTSALDPELEHLILQSLADLAREGATILMVAHRVKVLQLAHRVHVLRKGETLFVGKPQDFLERSDWRSYFEAE